MILKFKKFNENRETLLAPNGEISNLNPILYHIVRSEPFINWFGDWLNDPINSSKILDENGEPLVVYHGTSKQFNTFNHRFSAQGVFWFSSNKNKILLGDSGSASSNHLIPVFLRGIKITGWVDYDKLGLGQIEDRGVNVIKLDDDYIVFKPNDIKSANGNNRTFDYKSKDIRK